MFYFFRHLNDEATLHNTFHILPLPILFEKCLLLFKSSGYRTSHSLFLGSGGGSQRLGKIISVLSQSFYIRNHLFLGCIIQILALDFLIAVVIKFFIATITVLHANHNILIFNWFETRRKHKIYFPYRPRLVSLVYPAKESIHFKNFRN